jgi:DNA-binding HxlR family transcriptional regulator
LLNLVEDGLLIVVVKNADPFEAKYGLTDLGKAAAEFGVSEME